MQKKSKNVSLKQLELVSLKKQLVLNSIKTNLPNQEKEFLLFMANSANSFADYTKLEIMDLVDLFIEFEEEECEEVLTEKLIDELMLIYVPAFKTGLF